MKIAAIGLVALGLIASSPAAQAATGQVFSKVSARRGQAYVKTAMERPMADLLDSAEALKPDDVLAYGLALQLGRPAASLAYTAEQNARLETAMRHAGEYYLQAGEPDTDRPLAELPDFWIYTAAHIYNHLDADARFSNEYVITTQHLLPDEVEQLANRDDMTKIALNASDVAASQACAIYAQAGAVIRVTIRRLESEAAATGKPSSAMVQSQKTYDELVKAGSNACLDKAFFDDVSAFSESSQKP